MRLPNIIPTRQETSGVAPTSDAQLLSQFSKSGEEGPFAQLIARHGAAVYGFSRRLVNHVEDAEDIYQAAFLVLARKARSLAYRQSILGWLLQVVRKLAADVRRTEHRRLRHEKRVPEPTLPATASLLAESREAARLLVEELSKLPPKLREPILLCYWEDFPSQKRLDVCSGLKAPSPAVFFAEKRCCERGYNVVACCPPWR